ncbi:NAD(P)/FAD-dependent oxidoreductase [Lentzea sp. NPDC059081]|uniref:NAD(P)/FAD-dependent oxidoreductase n=1 Tax=Lentzea sp. NPDC059081 TaxID=3346719 RepID=UPI0036B0BA2F
MFDAIVVGARCAGASAALLLARAGRKVLLIDRSEFPSDTMSTLYLHQPGVARLARWGLLPAVAASGCPKLDRVTYQVRDVRLQGAAAVLGDVDGTYAPRRAVLDKIVADAAVAAGAEFRDATRLVRLTGDDRVDGVVLRDRAGGEVVEKAHVVIGADGMRSTVARLACAPPVRSDPLATCVYYSFWQGLPAHFEFHERTGGWVAVIPTNDGLTIIATYLPQDRFATIRADPLAGHLDAVRTTAPGVFDRAMAAERVDRLHGTGDQRNFFRQAWGPGWALIGDAGHHKDSITARGITDAMLQAELLADSIAPCLDDPVRLDAAAQEFGVARDKTLVEVYRSTLATARLEVGPARLAMLRAISTSPDLTSRYFGVIAGMNSMDDLITPDLLARL